MVDAEIRTLRPSRLESRRVVLALLISLCLHLGTWAGYELGKKYGWWEHLHLPAWLHQPEKKKPALLAVKKPEEAPLVFVDVSHADLEPPKKAQYYSSKNSQAANPVPRDLNQPMLDGKQKNVPKTEDVPVLPKLQPSPPVQPVQPAPKTKETEEEHLLDQMSLGDLKLHKAAEPKPEDQKPAEPKTAAEQRPRTLKQALAQQELPGQKLQQDGGVRRQRLWSSLDAKSTAFGDYDRAIIEAVTQRWYDMLDSHTFAQNRTGKVIVYFKLKPDGSVDELKILENGVGELLGYVCEEAVQDAMPFAKWPSDMRREIGANFREISFTFYYY